MQKQYVPVSGAVREAVAPDAVRDAAAEIGGRITLEGTLRSYVGSLHWHVQAPQETGTLEVTWWPTRQQLWVSLHANRSGTWAAEAFPRLVNALRSRLSAEGAAPAVFSPPAEDDQASPSRRARPR